MSTRTADLRLHPDNAEPNSVDRQDASRMLAVALGTGNAGAETSATRGAIMSGPVAAVLIALIFAFMVVLSTYIGSRNKK